MLKETTESEIDELEVHDVRCSVTKMPISTIPHWYAKVKVNFVSTEAARSKQAAMPVAAVVEEVEEEEEAEEPAEVSLEDVDENISGDDFDLGTISDTDEE